MARQDGPFKYDVYLGFSVHDMVMMHRLQEKLAHHDILCYPKYNAADSQQSIKTAICQGVARSQKCLLYVSQSFIEDGWYIFEVAEVLRKAKRFSRDMLIILKDAQLAVLPSDLSGFAVHDVTDARMLEDQQFLAGLAAALKKGISFTQYHIISCICIRLLAHKTQTPDNA